MGKYLNSDFLQDGSINNNKLETPGGGGGGTTIANVNDLSNALQGTSMPVSGFPVLPSITATGGVVSADFVSPGFVPPYMSDWRFCYELDITNRDGAFSSGTQIIEFTGINQTQSVNIDTSNDSPIPVKRYWRVGHFPAISPTQTYYKTQSNDTTLDFFING